VVIRARDVASVDYGEDDEAIRWLLGHDPDARLLSLDRYGWAHGIITKPIRNRIRDRELTGLLDHTDE